MINPRPLTPPYVPFGIRRFARIDRTFPFLQVSARCCASGKLGAPASVGGFTAPSCRQPPYGVFCCRCFPHERIGFRLSFCYALPLHTPAKSTMALLTSASPKTRLATRLTDTIGLSGRPPRVRTLPFPPSTRLIYCCNLRQYGLRFGLQSRPTATASLEIRVPRAGGLPPASFRFRLATDTLALG